MPDNKRNLLPHLLKENILLVLAVPFILIMGLIVWRMGAMRQRILRNAALEEARTFTQSLESFRTLYTAQVVARVLPEGIIVTHDYRERKGAIPLPATLSRELGKHIGENLQGAQARLYSDYPFPWRIEEGRMDDFETQALRQLRENPEEPVFRFETFQGKMSLRYAKADLMRRSCIACHNSHPQSPKTDWKEGDVRGALEVVIPIEERRFESVKYVRETLFLLIMVSGFGAFVIYQIAAWARKR